MSWVKVKLTNPDGSDAAPGTYRVQFEKHWYPREALVENGTSEIPMRRIGDSSRLLKPNEIVGRGGEPLKQVSLDEFSLEENEEFKVHMVQEGEAEMPNDEPPADVMSSLNPAQQVAFRRLWQRVPPHIRDVHFDFNAELWEPADIDKLGDLLCKFEDRFSKHGADLGRVTVDPFRIVLKPGAQPVRQRPYRYSPVLNEKVQIEIDELLLAGVLRHPIQIGQVRWWLSRKPMVV